MNARRILVIEDKRDMASLLASRLGEVVPQVDVAPDGASGFRKAADGSYDLIILDLMLPDGSGLDVCARLRRQQNHTPIIAVTARSSQHDKIAGFSSGVDDYVTKPFSMEELLYRVRALLRRVDVWRETAAVIPTITAGPLTIDVAKRRVRRGDETVELTAKEFDLLLLLSQAPGKVFPRAELLRSVWGYGHDGYRHTIDTHVSRLRGKIEADPANPVLIETVWGVGYRFSDTVADAS